MAYAKQYTTVAYNMQVCSCWAQSSNWKARDKTQYTKLDYLMYATWERELTLFVLEIWILKHPALDFTFLWDMGDVQNQIIS